MALGQTTSLEIQTLDGLKFSLPLAGPVTRGLAWILDFVVIVGLNWVVSVLVMPLFVLSTSWAAAVQALSLFVVTMGYGVTLEWFWNGQSVGKRVLRLRVMDERGFGLRFGQVVVRNLLRAIDAIPISYVVGGTAMVLTRHCQRLGDLAAGTVVVRSPSIREPRIENVLAGEYNSLRDHPIIEARLRQSTSPEEAHLVLSALMRRDELTPADRLRVFRELADHFRARADCPPELTATLTDERFLRNLAETLFRRKSR